MIVGLGVDVVDIARFARTVDRTPSVVDRLFTQTERRCGEGRIASLAAGFAAKEAVAKALGAPRGLRWHDVEVTRTSTGAPQLTVSGTVAAAAAERGVNDWQLSLAHDSGVAMAVVVAQR